jgi:hypothetical protein
MGGAPWPPTARSRGGAIPVRIPLLGRGITFFCLRGATRLVSTRVPTDLARAVELAAAQELISVAAFARRAIAIAVRGSTKE